MDVSKPKTPMTGAQRFAKYAAKMAETNKKEWCSKMKEKRANYLDRMTEQKREEMRKKDKERKKMKALDEMAFQGIKLLKGIRKLHHMEV